MAKEIAIKVTDLHKSFKLPKEHSAELKRAFINFVRGKKGYTEQKVLNGISFEIEKGDFFGIVGRNGSGKSTLLKTLAGIYTPEKGSVQINGSLVPFIELGVGFNTELTGRENIYMNGAMLGFSNEQVDAMYDEIVDFAELHDFMDQKLKNYSSGMQVRLAFSIAIRAESDILILDEVLAVGDEAFQRKCNDYFEKIQKDANQTVVLVTHSMEAVKKYCNKAIMIRNGKIVASGSPEDVANEYSLENLSIPKKDNKEDKKETKGRESVVKCLNAELLSSDQIDQNQDVKIRISYKTTKDIETNSLVYLNDVDRNFNIATSRSKTELHRKDIFTTDIVTFDLSAINDCSITAGVEIWDKAGNIICYMPSDYFLNFIIRRKKDNISTSAGVLHGRSSWENEK
jgi:ABC-2 type transport system ATP-binding protein